MSRITHAVATPNPPSPGYAEWLYTFVLQGRVEGQLCLNFLHYSANVLTNAGVPVNILERLRAKIHTAVVVPLLAAAGVNYTVETESVRLDWETGLTEIIQELLADVTDASGAIPGDALPSLAAVNMTKGYRVPGGQRRAAHNYFAGIAESDTTLSQVTGAAITRWDDVAIGMATRLLPDVGDLDWEEANPCMYRYVGGVPPVLPYYAIQTMDIITFDTILSTQRRRKFGRGS